MIWLSTASVLLALVSPSTAAAATPTAGSGPTTITLHGHSAKFDLRNLPQIAPPRTRHVRPNKEDEVPTTPLSPPGTPAPVGSGVATGPLAPAPPPSSSFDGLAYTDNCGGAQCGDGHPPDTNGDVGPTYYVETVNTSIGIFDKSTGARVAGVTFNSFMSKGAFGNLCDTDNFGDPVVLYDTFHDRWIITDFAFQVDTHGNIVNPPGSYQCFAVSQTGDPVSGGWNFYSLHITDALQDYPKFGVWPDGLYMSANMFGFKANGTFKNVRVWALNLEQMEAGNATTQAVQFDAPSSVMGTTVFTMLPSNARHQTGTPPAGTPDYFASVWGLTDRVRVWKFHVDWANTANSTFTGPTDSLTGSTWAAPPSTVPSKSGNNLDTLAIRLMMQNQYTNISGVESLWDSHTVQGSSSSQSAVRWYQIPITGGTIGSTTQAATWNPDSANRFMPSLDVDHQGDMAIGYTVSSSTLFPAIRYAGRLASDPIDTFGQTETSLIEGTGSQTGTCGPSTCTRWGDYSAMTLDPNGCTFWYANEYYVTSGLNDHTRIGAFSFPGCTPLTGTTPPIVSSINRADPNPTDASTVHWTVTFSESVTGVDPTDFSLADTGLTSPSITGVTGSGSTYTVTASTGTGDGSLGLNLVDDDSITDSSGNPLGGTGAGNGSFTGQVYTVDKTAPTVSSINRSDPNPTNATTLHWTVTFSESVTGVDSTDFSLANTALTLPSITGVTGSGSTYTVTASTGSGDGSLGLNLVDDDSITDAAGNKLGGTGAGNGSFTGQVYTVDKTAPTVSSIVRSDANPTNASTVHWTVTFSEPVTGVDSTDFSLATTGLTSPSITGVSGSGASYTVSASTGSGDGSLGLNLVDNDSITDAAGNKLGGSGSGNGNFTGQVYTVQKSAPTVSSINRTDPNPTNASTVHWTVTFSESVTGVDSTDFSLVNTGLTSPSITSVTGSGGTYTVAASTGSGDGSLGLNLVDDDSITDAAGNKLGGTGAGNGNFTGQVYTVDKTAPTVSSINRSDPNPTNATTVHWTVTFSESVTGVDSSDFALANTGLTAPSISSVTGSGSTYTVTASTGSGDGSLGLNLNDDDSITDIAGNPLGGAGTGTAGSGGSGNGSFTGQVYTVDKTPPSVSSINRADANPSSAPTVHWTVTFSESVTGVDPTDFSLANTGLTSPSITGVSGTGATYTVTASTGTGDGSLGLNLVDDDSITDAAGNKLGGTGAGNGNFTGQVYSVQKSVPIVSSINRTDPNPTNASTVHWTVTFSESVTGVDPTDFSLANTGLTSPSITGVTGSGSTYTVTASTGTGDGSLGLNLVDDDSITDSSGNPLGGTGAGNGSFTGQVYTVDKTAPTVSSINRSDPNPTNATTVHWTVTFSEPVTGVGASDFSLANTALTLPSITGVTGSGSTYTVTASTGTGDGSLGLNLVDDDSITDAAGNKLGGTGAGNGSFTGQVYTVDKTAPSSTVGFPISGSTMTTATFMGGCSTAATDDICGTASDTGGSGLSQVQVSIRRASDNHYWNGSDWTSSSEVWNTASGTATWSYVFSGPGQDTYTVRSRATDGASNQETAGPGSSFTIDDTAPTVSSIDRADANPTNASTVHWTVTFSENVTGVDPTDFSLADTGLTSPSITGVTGSGSTYTVTASTGTGDGWLGLNLVDDDSITDAAGNKLGGTGAGNGSFTGQAYTVDTEPPTSTVEGPSSLTGQVTVTFSEIVHGVTSADVVLERNSGVPVLNTLSCLDGAAHPVDCSTGNVVTAHLQVAAPLMIGQWYQVVVNPSGAGSEVVDGAGNPEALNTPGDFRAPTFVQQNTTGATYRWRTVRSSHAYGGSYTTDHLAGARATMTFSGRSITWFTITGPSQGLAKVSIDGVAKGTFDQYSSTTHFKVARRFRGLSPGTHTISIKVRGRKGSRVGTGSFVSIDAFRSGGILTPEPAPTYVWRNVRNASASGGSYVVSDAPGSSVTLRFRGSGLDWYTILGPNQGRATVVLDGANVATVDAYSATAHFGIGWSVTGIVDGVHTVRIVVLGKKRRASSGRSVCIDAFRAL